MNTLFKIMLAGGIGALLWVLFIRAEERELDQYAGGPATAKAIPNAKLLIIPGMGHSLPIETWPQVVEAITEHAVDAAA